MAAAGRRSKWKTEVWTDRKPNRLGPVVAGLLRKVRLRPQNDSHCSLESVAYSEWYPLIATQCYRVD